MNESSAEALLFAGDNYYASGGWWDLVGSFPDAHAAALHFDTEQCTSARGTGWAHIVVGGVIVATWGDDETGWEADADGRWAFATETHPLFYCSHSMWWNGRSRHVGVPAIHPRVTAAGAPGPADDPAVETRWWVFEEDYTLGAGVTVSGVDVAACAAEFEARRADLMADPLHTCIVHRRERGYAGDLWLLPYEQQAGARDRFYEAGARWSEGNRHAEWV